jgi:hypothetical protein
MSRSTAILLVSLALALGLHSAAPVSAQEAAGLAGSWNLNPALSQGPREVGFNTDMALPNVTDEAANGRRGATGNSRPFMARRESEDDGKRVRQLTDEVRDPSRHVTIVETSTAVTITDDHGHARTFHPNGQEEVIQLGELPVRVTAKRDAGALVVLYQVEQGRELRYAYSRVASPAQLIVDVQFVERGGGDHVRRIYEPGSASTMPAPTAAAPTPPTASAAQTLSSKPGDEFKGLTILGVVVEDLSAQAAACGLNQSTLERAVSKHLTDAGLKVRRNSDEDTYVYVNVITASLSSGLCVSRYDAFLTTHTTATLSYQQTPVLVEVSLLHKGGIAGGAAAAHADGVLKGVLEYVDQFAARIRDANQ